jgi:transposase
MPYTDEQRHQRMVAEKLRRMGKPRRILPHEFAVAEAKIRAFHSRGMSIQAIHERTGIGRKALGNIVNKPGTTKTLLRENYEAVLRLKYEAPSGGPHSGANMSPLGARRRLQALWLAGYSQYFLAEWMGSTVQQVSKVTRGATKILHLDFHQRVASMYDKLINEDPTLYIPENLVVRNRNLASGRGFAPAHCWDAETIDDPDAHPEWTGVCGTVQGRYVHEREGIPLCDACRGARNKRWMELHNYVFDREYLVTVMDNRGISTEKMAKDMHVSPSTVGNWRTGVRRPAPEKLDDIADYFGVNKIDLIAGGDA